MTRFLRFLFWAFVALHLLFGPGFIPRWLHSREDEHLYLSTTGRMGLHDPCHPPRTPLEVIEPSPTDQILLPGWRSDESRHIVHFIPSIVTTRKGSNP